MRRLALEVKLWELDVCGKHILTRISTPSTPGCDSIGI